MSRGRWEPGNEGVKLLAAQLLAITRLDAGRAGPTYPKFNRDQAQREALDWIQGGEHVLWCVVAGADPEVYRHECEKEARSAPEKGGDGERG